MGIKQYAYCVYVDIHILVQITQTNTSTELPVFTINKTHLTVVGRNEVKCYSQYNIAIYNQHL